ncbi:hypothetical protein [Nocardia sp. NBC_01499]|uniref:hypothetical protein n=1 Tax=Nocardia sp. NBC_01499 TaxID=2903597 RepID=UPI0038697620
MHRVQRQCAASAGVLSGGLRRRVGGRDGRGLRLTRSANADNVTHARLDTQAGYTLIGWDFPDDRPGHPPYQPGNNNVAVFVGGDDDELRGYFEKLSVGGTVTLPLEEQVWGDEAGSLVDQFGISWMFNITAQQH